MSLGKIIGAIGVGLVVFGAYLLISYLLLERRLTARAEGVVLGYMANRGKGRKAKVEEIAHLNVQYEVDGRMITAMERQSLQPSDKYGPGTKVWVLYDPNKPTDFRVESNREDFKSGWILLGVGAAMALVGFIFG